MSTLKRKPSSSDHLHGLSRNKKTKSQPYGHELIDIGAADQILEGATRNGLAIQTLLTGAHIDAIEGPSEQFNEPGSSSDHSLAFNGKNQEVPSSFLNSPIMFPGEDKKGEHHHPYDKDNSWSQQMNNIFSLLNNGLHHIDTFGLEQFHSQSYPHEAHHDSQLMNYNTGTESMMQISNISPTFIPKAESALTPSLSELSITEHDIGKMIFYINGKNMHHHRLNLNFRAYGMPRKVHNQVKNTITTELELQDEYAKLYNETRNHQQFVKRAKKRRNPLQDQNKWEPESLYKAYTNIKPKYFDKSDYPTRIPPSSCFGKINMRVKGAWSRTIGKQA